MVQFPRKAHFFSQFSFFEATSTKTNIENRRSQVFCLLNYDICTHKIILKRGLAIEWFLFLL